MRPASTEIFEISSSFTTNSPESRLEKTSKTRAKGVSKPRGSPRGGSQETAISASCVENPEKCTKSSKTRAKGLSKPRGSPRGGSQETASCVENPEKCPKTSKAFATAKTKLDRMASEVAKANLVFWRTLKDCAAEEFARSAARFAAMAQLAIWFAAMARTDTYTQYCSTSADVELRAWLRSFVDTAKQIGSNPSNTKSSAMNYPFERLFFGWGGAMWTTPRRSPSVITVDVGDLFIFHNDEDGVIELFGVIAVTESNREWRPHWVENFDKYDVSEKQGSIYLTPKLGEVRIEDYKAAIDAWRLLEPTTLTGYGLKVRGSDLITFDRYGKDKLKECLLNAETDPSRWTATSVVLPPETYVNTKRFLTEGMVRHYLSQLTGEAFEPIRPDWLKGPLGRNYELDGYSERLNLAFEYNGIQHAIHSEFFHGGGDDGMRAFEAQQERDRLKNELCVERGVYLMTFRHDEVWAQMKPADFQRVVKLRFDEAVVEQRLAEAQRPAEAVVEQRPDEAIEA